MDKKNLRRAFVRMDNLKPGMIVSEDVMLEFGTVLVPKGTKLTERTLNRFRMLGIKGAYVFLPASSLDNNEGESSEIIIEDDVPDEIVLERVYNNAHSVVKNTMENVRSNGKIDIAATMNVVEEIADKITNCTDVVRGLQELRKNSEYTYRHCVDVAILCGLMGRWLKLSDKNLRNLIHAGLLHDVGKAKIPLSILNKPDKLNDKEFAIIKNHPLYGYEIMSKSGYFDKSIYYAVLFHHEREDGSGYPFGLSGESIPHISKIVAVMDTYDAMVSQRPYKGRYSPYYVIDVLQWNSIGKLDVNIVNVFISHIVDLFIGDRVKLSDGRVGRVVYLDKSLPTRPLVELEDGSFVDLREDYNLYIADILLTV